MVAVVWVGGQQWTLQNWCNPSKPYSVFIWRLNCPLFSILRRQAEKPYSIFIDIPTWFFRFASSWVLPSVYPFQHWPLHDCSGWLLFKEKWGPISKVWDGQRGLGAISKCLEWFGTLRCVEGLVSLWTLPIHNPTPLLLVFLLPWLQADKWNWGDDANVSSSRLSPFCQHSGKEWPPLAEASLNSGCGCSYMSLKQLWTRPNHDLVPSSSVLPRP